MTMPPRSKDRKYRQRKRGIERNHRLKLAYDESKKALSREQRFKKALERENITLKSRLCAKPCSITHTKASMLCGIKPPRVCVAPSNIRLISWEDIKEACITNNVIGTGAFATCYLAQLGSLNTVCIKLLHAGDRYRSLIYSEGKILSKLCHVNLPWIHGFCDDSNRTALLITYHPYNGKNISMHFHGALHKHKAKISNNQWRQLLLGCCNALVYLKGKSVLHNDIKSDNILIERMPPRFIEVRAVLIDFNKACLSCDARKYNLSNEEKIYYAEHHPHIAPEVRSGSQIQSFASDVYSMGRIIDKVNVLAMGEVPCISSMAEMCKNLYSSKRPTAEELQQTFSSLLAM